MPLTRGRVLATFEEVEHKQLGTRLPDKSLLVEPLSSSRKWFAAVDSEGSWALVLGSRKSSRRPPALRLSSLQADYGVTYQLHQGANVEVLRVSVIRCISSDSEIRKLFATFCVSVLESVSADAHDIDVEEQVNKWASLFWRLREPARNTVVGLIGELTLLNKVEQTSDWVRAWHSDPGDNLDFAFNSPALSVEVKATSAQQRVHEISIHQVIPTIADNHYFASVIVELRDAGDRVGDIVDGITERLDEASLANKFWKSLGDTCGSSLPEFLNVRYMSKLAGQSLRFYRAEAIPRPELTLPLPPGVSRVRFHSDFSSAEQAEAAPLLKFTSAD